MRTYNGLTFSWDCHAHIMMGEVKAGLPPRAHHEGGGDVQPPCTFYGNLRRDAAQYTDVRYGNLQGATVRCYPPSATL